MHLVGRGFRCLKEAFAFILRTLFSWHLKNNVFMDYVCNEKLFKTGS